MLIYSVVVNDRYSDTEFYPYLNKEQALIRAETETKVQLKHYPDHQIDRTLYADNRIYNHNILASGAQVQVIATETQDSCV